MEGKVDERSRSDESPGTSVSKKIPLTARAKKIIVNFYNYFAQQSPLDCDKTSLYTKTAEILGLEPSQVYTVLKEHVQGIAAAVTKGPAFEMMSETEKSATRKIVYTLFENNEMPTVEKVMEVVNDDDGLPTFTELTFHKMMKRLQFQYVQRGGMNIVNDRDEMVVWRREYLNKIAAYRKENRSIFYIDEGWIDMGTEFTKENKKTLIILHIGNENGFLPGAGKIFQPESRNYKNAMLPESFACWFEETAAKLANAVVVLDDAPWHSKRFNKTPSVTWPKVDVQDWLRERHIEFTDDEIKVQLLEKVDQLKIPPMYEVDEIAKKYKIDVLRLPPFHCELNPMTSVLAEIIHGVMKTKYVSLDEARDFLEKRVSKYPGAKWEFHVEKAKEQETYFYKIDDIMDYYMDSLVDDLDADSDSESSDEWSISDSD